MASPLRADRETSTGLLPSRSVEQRSAGPATQLQSGYDQWIASQPQTPTDWGALTFANPTEDWQRQYNELPAALRPAYLNASVNRQSTDAGMMFGYGLLNEFNMNQAQKRGVLNDLYNPERASTGIENGILYSYSGSNKVPLANLAYGNALATRNQQVSPLYQGWLAATAKGA